MWLLKKSVLFRRAFIEKNLSTHQFGVLYLGIGELVPHSGQEEEMTIPLALWWGGHAL